jgi:HEAT repeat protein
MRLLWQLRASSIGLLREYLDSSDARDGVAAVQALERIGSEAAVAALVEGLRSASPLVAAYIARALIKLNARGELPAIIAFLHDRADELSGQDKQFVIGAMRKVPHVSAVPVLADSLRDRRRGVRKSAALTLLRIRAVESIEALQTAADELGFWKGRQARRALHVKLAAQASGAP